MSRRMIFALLASTAAFLAGCDSETAPLVMPAPEVTVITVQTEPLTLTRELPGRVTSSQMAEVRPQVTGIVQKRLFTEGTMVTAGQALYQIDDATYQAQTNSAKASLARAEAVLESARSKAKRALELVKTKAISQQDSEDSVAALHQAEADVAVAKAEVARTEVVLGYTRITSPIDGFIGKSNVTAGALVTVNQDKALATVQQLDPIYVDLTQTSSELLQLRNRFAANVLEGATKLPVTLLLEDGSEYQHAGTLAFSEVSIDPSTGSMALRVVVPNAEKVLLPGMYVRAVVSSGERQDALLVPQLAVTRDPKGSATVMLVGADHKVEVRSIQVSRTVGDQWLVESGLESGEQVIVAGLQRIRPGMEVVASQSPVQPEAASPAEGGTEPSEHATAMTSTAHTAAK